MYYRNLNSAEKKQLTDLLAKIDNSMPYYAGFPPNTAFDYSELYPFLAYSINNLGDPFSAKNNPHSTHEFECEVLRYMAGLVKAPEDFSGYVTNGGSEGNLYGLYLARTAHPNGIVYFSEHTHYSIIKYLDLLQMPFEKIASQKNGEMDYQDLYNKLKKHHDKPAIIFATLGSTVLGAIDNIALIKKTLEHVSIQKYFIHADAAFSGMVLPFVDDPQPFQFPDGVDCFSVSGHKFIGSPIPCGVVLARKEFTEGITRELGLFLGHRLDSTLSGSRNGITPLFLWYALKRQGDEGFRQLVQQGFAKVDYAIHYFKEHGIDAWTNKNSMMVVIPQLSELLLKKWSVPAGFGYSSLTALPKLTHEMIHEICIDIKGEK
ncbi:MAG: histidine decarboxylase [Gammaproteobacteria bacterium]|jgi:histidine decarboxylase